MRAAVIALAASAVLACASSYVPRANTRTDVQRYVERAAQLVAQRGIGACDTLKTPQWMAGDHYIFLTDASTHVTVCHPVPGIAGRNDFDLQDANGKYFIREMLSIASDRAEGGWVDYLWPRPGQTQPEVKSTFVMTVAGPDGTRYMVGSGGYGMAR